MFWPALRFISLPEDMVVFAVIHNRQVPFPDHFGILAVDWVLQSEICPFCWVAQPGQPWLLLAIKYANLQLLLMGLGSSPLRLKHESGQYPSNKILVQFVSTQSSNTIAAQYPCTY